MIFKDITTLLVDQIFSGRGESISVVTSRAFRYWRQHGIQNFVDEVSRQATQVRSYQEWIRRFDTLSGTDRTAIRSHLSTLAYRPIISILLPVYNPPKELLRKAIDSVRAQLYPEWELCVADDASTLPHVRDVLESYRRKDQRINVFYRSVNGHISAASNSALDMATGEFVALLDHDDELPEHALYLVAAKLNEHPDADLLYSDEDKIDEKGTRFDPYFKPDWNPDLLCSHNFVSHLGVYRTKLVRTIGGFRTGYEGSQDYDLALRMSEQIPSGHIQHIPFVLYHWRTAPGSAARGIMEKPYAESAARKAIQSHFDRLGIAAKCTPADIVASHRAVYLPPDPLPLVTLVVWTQESEEGAGTDLKDLVDRTAYKALEILIAGYPSPSLEAWTERNGLNLDIRLTHISKTQAGNLAELYNHAAASARGDILAFLNRGLEVMDAGWLHEMVSHAVRPEIGAVGAKLYYRNNKVQHGGFILWDDRYGVPYSYHQTLTRKAPGYVGKAWLIQNVSAVSMDCLILSRKVFHEVGGFDTEHLSEAYVDIDLCLRLRERGYRILWTPHAELRWRAHESVPYRGEALRHDLAYMHKRWGESWSVNDPYWNPNLDPKTGDFALTFPPKIRHPWTTPYNLKHGTAR